MINELEKNVCLYLDIWWSKGGDNPLHRFVWSVGQLKRSLCNVQTKNNTSIVVLSMLCAWSIIFLLHVIYTGCINLYCFCFSLIRDDLHVSCYMHKSITSLRYAKIYQTYTSISINSVCHKNIFFYTHTNTLNLRCAAPH